MNPAETAQSARHRDGSRRRWRALACGLFAVVAGASFLFLNGGGQGTAFVWLSFLLLLVAPILVLGIAVLSRNQDVIKTAMLHASVLAWLLFIGAATSQDISGLDTVALTGGALVLLVELAVAYFAAFARRHEVREMMIFPILTSLLISAWLLGALAWSETRPSLVVAGAQKMAAQRPYCLLIGGYRTVAHRRDFTGFSMAWAGGRGRDFYSLMIIGTGESKSFANWSHRFGAFVDVRDSARQSLQLDDRAKCDPVENFASRL